VACPMILCYEPCKNGSTGRDAIWVMDSGRPKEACPEVQITHAKGQFLGERTFSGMPEDTLM